MNIKLIADKLVTQGFSALSDEERVALKENLDLLSKEQREIFAEGEKEIGERLDVEKLAELIANKTAESAGVIAEQLVNKFQASIVESRSKILAGAPESQNKKADEGTRKFLRALVGKDGAALAEIQKAMTTSSSDDAKAGYTIPIELMTEVLRIQQAGYGIARQLFRYLPFSGPGNERKIPTLASSVTVTWTGEGVAKTSTQPGFGLVTQTLKKLAAIVPLTEELIEDSAIPLTQLVAQLFAEATQKEEDAQFLAGTGSPWTGLLNNGSVNMVTLGAGEGFSEFTADDLLDMIDATPAGALPRARFVLHRHALTVVRKLKDSITGQYVWQRPADGQPGTIWDYPYTLAEAFPNKTLTGVHKPFIAFGDFQTAGIIGDKQQIRVKLLDQATITDTDGETTINLAEQDMIALRMEERVGYLLAVPSAVTILRTGAAS